MPLGTGLPLLPPQTGGGGGGNVDLTPVTGRLNALEAFDDRLGEERVISEWRAILADNDFKIFLEFFPNGEGLDTHGSVGSGRDLIVNGEGAILGSPSEVTLGQRFQGGWAIRRNGANADTPALILPEGMSVLVYNTSTGETIERWTSADIGARVENLGAGWSQVVKNGGFYIADFPVLTGFRVEELVTTEDAIYTKDTLKVSEDSFLAGSIEQDRLSPAAQAAFQQAGGQLPANDRARLDRLHLVDTVGVAREAVQGDGVRWVAGHTASTLHEFAHLTPIVSSGGDISAVVPFTSELAIVEVGGADAVRVPDVEQSITGYTIYRLTGVVVPGGTPTVFFVAPITITGLATDQGNTNEGAIAGLRGELTGKVDGTTETVTSTEHLPPRPADDATTGFSIERAVELLYDKPDGVAYPPASGDIPNELVGGAATPILPADLASIYVDHYNGGRGVDTITGGALTGSGIVNDQIGGQFGSGAGAAIVGFDLYLLPGSGQTALFSVGLPGGGKQDILSADGDQLLLARFDAGTTSTTRTEKRSLFDANGRTTHTFSGTEDQEASFTAYLARTYNLHFRLFANGLDEGSADLDFTIADADTSIDAVTHELTFTDRNGLDHTQSVKVSYVASADQFGGTPHTIRAEIVALADNTELDIDHIQLSIDYSESLTTTDITPSTGQSLLEIRRGVKVRVVTGISIEPDGLLSLKIRLNYGEEGFGSSGNISGVQDGSFDLSRVYIGGSGAICRAVDIVTLPAGIPIQHLPRVDDPDESSAYHLPPADGRQLLNQVLNATDRSATRQVTTIPGAVRIPGLELQLPATEADPIEHAMLFNAGEVDVAAPAFGVLQRSGGYDGGIIAAPPFISNGDLTGLDSTASTVDQHRIFRGLSLPIQDVAENDQFELVNIQRLYGYKSNSSGGTSATQISFTPTDTFQAGLRMKQRAQVRLHGRLVIGEFVGNNMLTGDTTSVSNLACSIYRRRGSTDTPIEEAKTTFRNLSDFALLEISTYAGKWVDVEEGDIIWVFIYHTRSGASGFWRMQPASANILANVAPNGMSIFFRTSASTGAGAVVEPTTPPPSPLDVFQRFTLPLDDSAVAIDTSGGERRRSGGYSGVTLINPVWLGSGFFRDGSASASARRAQAILPAAVRGIFLPFTEGADGGDVFEIEAMEHRPPEPDWGSLGPTPTTIDSWRAGIRFKKAGRARFDMRLLVGGRSPNAGGAVQSLILALRSGDPAAPGTRRALSLSDSSSKAIEVVTLRSDWIDVAAGDLFWWRADSARPSPTLPIIYSMPPPSRFLSMSARPSV